MWIWTLPLRLCLLDEGEDFDDSNNDWCCLQLLHWCWCLMSNREEKDQEDNFQTDQMIICLLIFLADLADSDAESVIYCIFNIVAHQPQLQRELLLPLCSLLIIGALWVVIALGLYSHLLEQQGGLHSHIHVYSYCNYSRYCYDWCLRYCLILPRWDDDLKHHQEEKPHCRLTGGRCHHENLTYQICRRWISKYGVSLWKSFWSSLKEQQEKDH